MRRKSFIWTWAPCKVRLENQHWLTYFYPHPLCLHLVSHTLLILQFYFFHFNLRNSILTFVFSSSLNSLSIFLLTFSSFLSSFSRSLLIWSHSFFLYFRNYSYSFYLPSSSLLSMTSWVFSLCLIHISYMKIHSQYVS